MKLCTVNAVGGETVSVNIEQITHLTENVAGTIIHLTSGEKVHVTSDIAQLTLALASAAVG